MEILACLVDQVQLGLLVIEATQDQRDQTERKELLEIEEHSVLMVNQEIKEILARMA